MTPTPEQRGAEPTHEEVVAWLTSVGAPRNLRRILAWGHAANDMTERGVKDPPAACARAALALLAARPGAGEAKPCPICQRAGGSLGALCSRHPACPVPTPAPAPDAALAGRPDVSIAPSSLRELADEADRRSRARGIMPSEMGRELHLRDVLRAAADALARGGTTTNQDTNNG